MLPNSINKYKMQDMKSVQNAQYNTVQHGIAESKLIVLLYNQMQKKKMQKYVHRNHNST